MIDVRTVEPGDLSSRCKSCISNSALVLNEASSAPASVPVANNGEVCSGGDQATAAVRFISFKDILLLLLLMFVATTIRLD